MPPEFELDMSAAVNEIGGGLGFDTSSDEGGLDDDLSSGLDAGGTSDAGGAVAAGESGTAASGAFADGKPAGTDGGTDSAAVNDGTPATAAADPAAEPPKTWRAEAKATWAALPPEAKAEILKREDDIFRGIEVYKADASFGKSLKGALAPYLPILEQYKIDPTAQVKQLMEAHHTLALGTPEQKLALFQRLAQDYQIDMGQLQSAGGEAPYIDPAVAALQTELRAVKSQLSTAEQHRLAQERSALEKQIETFSKDPANAYFNEVANDMAELLQRGVCKTLPEAYEKAIWTNPAVRAKEVARQQAEAASKAAQEATARAAAARKATAANVRTSAKGGSAAAPLGSIDDTLNEALANIRARG